MTTETTSGSHRVRELDGLRGVAILMVVFFHFFQRFGEFYPYGHTIFPLARYGDLGVHLFFIISGFVIAFTLERVSGPAMFVRHRFLRLWPPIFVASLMTFSVMQLVGTPFAEARRVGIEGFLPSLTFTPPEFWASLATGANYIDGAYWSLFVEVRFYFWAIVIATLFGSQSLERIMAPAVVLLSVAWHIFQDPALRFYLDMLCVSIFLVFFVVLVLHRSWLRALTWPPLVWVGTISYSLYLLHQNIGVTMLTALPQGWPDVAYVVASVAVLCVLMALSWLVYLGVERPAQAMARRFDRRDGLE